MNYLIFFFNLLLITAPHDTRELSLTISNIKHIEGTIEIGIFDSGERFLEAGQAYRRVSVKVNSDSVTVVIKDLPKGSYAISLYHDINGNGKCDRNVFGIPKEPYAFSTNFKPRFSAPTFKDCQFDLTSDHFMEIKLLH